MTDIVERLRAATHYPPFVYQEAADEIERLRSRLKWFEDAGGVAVTTKVHQQHAEIERLRKLLREVIENGGATSTVMYDPKMRGCTRIVWDGKEWEKRAREALGDD